MDSMVLLGSHGPGWWIVFPILWFSAFVLAVVFSRAAAAGERVVPAPANRCWPSASRRRDHGRGVPRSADGAA